MFQVARSEIVSETADRKTVIVGHWSGARVVTAASGRPLNVDRSLGGGSVFEESRGWNKSHTIDFALLLAWPLLRRD